MTRLDERRQSALFRRRHPRSVTQFSGQFASNDYLSLSQHPQVIKAAQNALQQWGTGSSGSPLLSGYSQLHQQLEEALADWLGVPAVLLFSSGFAANHGTLTTLIEQGTIYLDRLCHASLVDGVLSSGRRFKRFAHNDFSRVMAQPDDWLIAEGTYSMDGDRVAAADVAKQIAQSQSSLFLDDAHGLGVWGPAGRGTFASLQPHTRVLTGTFGKAFGVGGAFVAASDDDIETLIQFCREYIYSTAFPPAQAAAISASLAIIRSDEGDELRGQLARNITYFKRQFVKRDLPLIASDSPIQSWVVGDDNLAVSLGQRLQHHHIQVSAVRPPTVPKGSARLRFSLQSRHSKDDIDALCQSLDEIMQ